ncbi:hypothetical protein [Pelagibacterium sp. H642]|uniref:hypothetical protein n=1 Tax=Pelagibacterium sp. H642 TaxID=1881069 RepID=UPI00281610A0|nr:hypothetical protein [Pelagibacterium sp. H642]WMT90963.1 hypothetical protein NO934_01530 [Pelagibacterium sp. H642]
MSDFAPLEKIYTLAEASERLRLNKNALARIARRTGHCSVTGRTVLFSESDLIAIWKGIRVEPTRKVARVAHVGTIASDDRLELFFGPKVLVDKRVVVILQWLSTQKRPKTLADIARCGPRTIEELLRKGLVVDRGKDAGGHTMITISPAGRNELTKIERWKERRRKAGLSDAY